MTGARVALLAVIAGCFTKPPFDGPRDSAIGSDADALEDAPRTIDANVVFVTSQPLSVAQLGGLPGADEICASRAAAAGLTGRFRAWLSDNNQSAYGRISATGARGWIRPDGAPVADTLEDLLAGRMFYPIRIDEAGMDVHGVDVITGTGADGLQSSNDCSGLNAGGISIQTGASDATHTKWTDNQNAISCTMPASIYCFQTDKVAQVSIAPTPGRHAFVSTPWATVANGIAGANAHCQTESDGAGLGGMYKALVTSNSVSPMTTFTIGPQPWVRRDGVPLAATPQAVLDGAIDAPLNVDVLGGYVPSVQVWTGIPVGATPSSLGIQTCTEWETSSMSVVGTFGVTTHTDTTWYTQGSLTCNNALRLYCFEQ